MTGSSGILGEDPSSPEEAAGESPTSAAKAGNGPGRKSSFWRRPARKAPGRKASSRKRPGRKRPGRRQGSPQWRVAFFGLLAAGVVAVAGWAVFLSPFLVVRSVVVTGTHLVPKSEILAAAAVEPGTPLIRVNTARAAAQVGLIRQIRSARVTRSWPDRVVIAVTGRVPALVLTAPGGGYDLLDADGVVVRWSARPVPGLPLYLTSVPVTALRGDQDLAAAAAVLGELPAPLRHSVTSVTAPAPDQVTLGLTRARNRVTVVWGGTGRAAAKAEELAVLMRSRLSYYDVSAPGSVLAR